MPPRRRVRYVRTARRSKYQMTTVNLAPTFQRATNQENPEATSTFGSIVICPQSNVAGVRKFKNLSLDITTMPDNPNVYFYCILYIPEGTSVGNIGVNNTVPGDVDVYNTFTEMIPSSQWVIANGSFSARSPARIRSRLARNLNNGDSIYLIIGSRVYGADDGAPGDAQPWLTQITGNYAIRYN